MEKTDEYTKEVKGRGHIYSCLCFCLVFFFSSLQASILDLHSGALSMGKQFVNLYRWESLPCLVLLHVCTAGIRSCILCKICRNVCDSVINLYASPCELASWGLVIQRTSIHHCQQKPILFGSSAALCPSPSLITPPLIHFSPLYIQGCRVLQGRQLKLSPQ